jgi:peptidoglycan-associated lipoprotein
MSRIRLTVVLVGVLAVLTAAGCSSRRNPTPQPAPDLTEDPEVVDTTPPAPPSRLTDTLPPPPAPLVEDEIANRSLDELNRDSPLRPVFFAFDSSELDDAGRAAASANAEVLRRYPTWVITVEGHCDERGTPEYNLALGERRATSVKTYLASLGVPGERVRVVSYGKEFPFDPGHTEQAWAQNRRGHFVITSR